MRALLSFRTIVFGFSLVCLCGLSQGADESTSTEKTASTGMKLVLVPAGEFMMGAVESAEDLVAAFPAYKRKPDFFKDEYPQHRVRITKPFYLGKYEVTVGDFKKFVAETGYKTQAETDDGSEVAKGRGGWGYDPKTGKCDGRFPQFSWRDPGFPQTDAHPAINVTWNDAQAFCKWMSAKEGKTVRLPTEAEWEYACRGGTTTRYNTGAEPASLVKNANVMNDAGRKEFPHVQEMDIPKDELLFTKAVGGYSPNKFGLCDMHGNVWEWCSDFHAVDYYSKSPTDDPQGPAEGTKRVRRGGAWNSFPLWARASFRNWNTPQSRCVNLGFRVVEEK